VFWTLRLTFSAFLQYNKWENATVEASKEPRSVQKVYSPMSNPQVLASAKALEPISDGPSVLAALERLCLSVGPGGRIPGHVELMGALNASERAVRAALRDLQEQGRLTRKRGLGTFVAEGPATPTHRGKTIVAIARPDRSFYDRCVELLYGYAAQHEFGLLFHPTSENASPSQILASADGSEYGFLVFGYNLVDFAERLRNAGRRTVLIGAPPAGTSLELPCVFNDHKTGGFLVAKHLIGLGHRRIAAWQGNEQNHVTLGRRWLGYQRAVAEARSAGIQVTWNVLEVSSEWEAQPSLAAQFLNSPTAPTALVAWNDAEAVRLLITLMRAGISVPDQVSVTGYDDLPEGSLAYPPLTTVHHGIEQQIDAAVEMLFSREPIERRQTIIVPTLVQRTSAAPPP
jgi:DNA-binding LacI/PurR family transcriptional regulator